MNRTFDTVHAAWDFQRANPQFARYQLARVDGAWVIVVTEPTLRIRRKGQTVKGPRGWGSRKLPKRIKAVNHLVHARAWMEGWDASAQNTYAESGRVWERGYQAGLLAKDGE